MRQLLLGDCSEVLKGLPDNSVDSVVTDPPYGLSFMGKRWDYDVPNEDIWRECLRVLKPGGHLLAFAGTRTQHRMAVRIEDAGFEIRDMIAWVYSSGFPKSLDVSKAIDRAAGAVREVVGDGVYSDPATDAARQWQGWGSALKPALEPITLARKPFKGTIAANVLTHGTGALNVDGCRVKMGAEYDPTKMQRQQNANGNINFGAKGLIEKVIPKYNPSGRWPANLIHDGSDEVTELFSNDAARFFYCSKASKKDRGEDNKHPTVKPTDLMRYLCRLVTPPGGTVLDPFMGSGSTGAAALLEGFAFIGIERDPDYFAIALDRVGK